MLRESERLKASFSQPNQQRQPYVHPFKRTQIEIYRKKRKERKYRIQPRDITENFSFQFSRVQSENGVISKSFQEN